MCGNKSKSSEQNDFRLGHIYQFWYDYEHFGFISSVLEYDS